MDKFCKMNDLQKNATAKLIIEINGEDEKTETAATIMRMMRVTAKSTAMYCMTNFFYHGTIKFYMRGNSIM